MIYDYPSVSIINGKVTFNNGKYLNIPHVYLKQSNQEILHDFYSKLFLNQKDDVISGEDPLGFFYFKLDFICYVGLVIENGKRGKYNKLRKKYPKHKFVKEYISKRLREEIKLVNHKEYIPIEVISHNLHELRGLNAKISSNIDTLLQVDDESQWDDKFDNAELLLMR